MEKIAAHLRACGEANKSALRGLGKAEYVDMAIALMLEEGAINRRKQGQAHLFWLANTQAEA